MSCCGICSWIWDNRTISLVLGKIYNLPGIFCGLANVRSFRMFRNNRRSWHIRILVKISIQSNCVFTKSEIEVQIEIVVLSSRLIWNWRLSWSSICCTTRIIWALTWWAICSGCCCWREETCLAPASLILSLIHSNLKLIRFFYWVG